MSRLRPLTRLGWAGRFALFSAIPVVVVGVLLVLEVRSAQHERMIAEHEAEIAARAAALQLPPFSFSAEKLTRSQRQKLDRSLGRFASSGSAGSVRLWSRERRVVHSTEEGGSRSDAQTAAALGNALGGKVESTPVAGPPGDRLDTFAPLHAPRGGRVVGALEVRRPWSSIASAARLPVLNGPGGVIGALALLWLALQGVARSLRQGGPPPARPLTQDQLDPLTGLPNRTAFREVLEQSLIAGKRGDALVAVLIMDMDRFKEINDTLGHYNGDLLLKRVGPRLRSVLREQDTVARLGGDEFGIVMPGLPDDGSVMAATKRVVDVFKEPFVLGGLALEVEASVGVAMYPEHGNRVDVLINRADTAMYAAKAARGGYAVYSDEQEQGSRRRLALAGELRRAITEDEIILHFQPKVRIATGSVTGVEALARWGHPTQGVVSPVEFIPIAEQTNQLSALTERILDRALAQVSEWRERGFDLTVAVNLSMRNLLDASLADQVYKLLHRNRVEASSLELELTEGSLMSDPRRAREVLCRLKEVGVTVSVDDFGTGYSSLAYLKDLPVDVIKIDKSFVLGMEQDSRNAAIVRSTVDLGRNLGLKVVAEGVETQSTYEELGQLGCDFAQGYLLSRPLPAVELTARVAELEQERAVGEAGGRPRPLALVKGQARSA